MFSLFAWEPGGSISSRLMLPVHSIHTANSENNVLVFASVMPAVTHVVRDGGGGRVGGRVRVASSP
jgi:hypothetical protein